MIKTDLTVTVPDAKAGEPPPELRLRQWLKLGLRAFGIRAAWAPSRDTHDTSPSTNIDGQEKGGNP